MQTRKYPLLALSLAAAMAVPAAAQTTAQVQNDVDKQQTLQSTQQPAASSTTGTDRQPLELQSKEGFWGKLNPFARKKYVRRQMAPVIGRVNELDELTAQNARLIKDLDARASEGIRLANLRVTEADNRAVEAGNKATVAQQAATQANTRIQSVESALQNLDQYKPVTEAEIRFRPGQSRLSRKAKEALDEIANNMKDQKGLIVNVQGFSSGRGTTSIENSQRMAAAVARYLVIEHEIPVYRIYTVGMGNAPLKTAEGKNRRISGGRVEVALLSNGIAELNQHMASQNGVQRQPAGGAQDNSALPQSDQPVQQQKQPPQQPRQETEQPK